MLKSELYQLEKFIGEILANETEANTIRYPGHLDAELRNVQLLCQSLKAKWVHGLFSSVKEQVLKRYVHYHQAGLTNLSDRISECLADANPATKNNAPYRHGYQQLLSELENLLIFFKRSFYPYFDLDYRVTIYQCQKNAEEFGPFKTELNKLGGKLSLIPIIDVLLLSVSDRYEEAGIEGMSYRQVDQVLNLLRMAFQMLNVITDIAPGDLAEAFYKQNLNTLYFFNWYKDFLKERFNSAPGETGRQAAINRELLKLENVFVDPGKSFEAELPSINFMVLNWLREQSGNQADTSPTADKKFTNGQLGLTLSVAQFALFIRVFYQAGCFSTTNISRIMRFFTHYFATKKQSNISLKSFGRAFYSTDQSAAAVVRDLLQRMINYIDKTFFP